MTTFADMQNRIADETFRLDLMAPVAPQTNSPVKNAIFAAIQRYQRERFYFSEKQATWSTVKGQEYYGTTDGVPSDLIETDSLSIVVYNQSYTLNLRDFAYIEAVQTNSNFVGIPFDYAYYAQKFRLYPIPTAVFPLILSYFARIAAPVADTDVTVWMTDAEALIRCAAKKDIYANYLRDSQAASEMAALEADELAALRSETTERTSTGFCRPTRF